MLPERGYRIEAARRRVAEYGQRFRQTRQLVEGSAHLGSHVGCLFGSPQELLALLKVAVAKSFHSTQSADQMSLR